VPEWLQVLLGVLVIVAVLGGAWWWCDKWQTAEQAKMNVCLEAGYAARLEWQGTWFCVGYDREGMPVIAKWRSLWEVYSR
jgi:hypothetical protein